MPENVRNRLQRFNRLLVWPTLALFIVLAVSGYGTVNSSLVSQLTAGLLNHPRSLYLHTNMILPTLTLLMVHVLIALRSTLTRWGLREGKLLDGFLIVLGAFTVTLMLIMQYLTV